jgi:amino acid transporter
VLVTGKHTIHLNPPRKMFGCVIICLLVKTSLYLIIVIICIFVVPLEFIEQASRDLRVYLSAKNSLALCILDHLDFNYIFGNMNGWKYDIFIKYL